MTFSISALVSTRDAVEGRWKYGFLPLDTTHPIQIPISDNMYDTSCTLAGSTFVKSSAWNAGYPWDVFVHKCKKKPFRNTY
jgi:hypothetical protein